MTIIEDKEKNMNMTQVNFLESWTRNINTNNVIWEEGALKRVKVAALNPHSNTVATL
ncbi:hypothetical protein HanIR_Chr02g0080791 [Helianthus annuus]|nr:hypothetical protein HanIR_Chr02g0080791 [Helianthus annuus]